MISFNRFQSPQGLSQAKMFIATQGNLIGNCNTFNILSVYTYDISCADTLHARYRSLRSQHNNNYLYLVQLSQILSCIFTSFHGNGPDIARAGPLPHTIVDFWRLVWQEKIKAIAMVTNLREGMKVKCEQYWPEQGCEMQIGPYMVTNVEQQSFPYFNIRKIQLQVSFPWIY